jgi:hypothetical protein
MDQDVCDICLNCIYIKSDSLDAGLCSGQTGKFIADDCPSVNGYYEEMGWEESVAGNF